MAQARNYASWLGPPDNGKPASSILWVNQGIYLNLDRDAQYDLRYIPELGHLGLSGNDAVHVFFSFTTNAWTSARTRLVGELLQIVKKRIELSRSYRHMHMLCIYSYTRIYSIQVCVYTYTHVIQDGNDMLTGTVVCYMFLSWSCTELLSPPEPALPHVTTDPSPRMAAKA